MEMMIEKITEYYFPLMGALFILAVISAIVNDTFLGWIVVGWMLGLMVSARMYS